MYSKPTFLLIVISMMLVGCKTSQQSWLYSADSPVAIYEDPGLTKEIITVPPGRNVFVEKKNPFGLVAYEETRGYTDLQAFKTRKKIGRRDLRRLHFSSDSMMFFPNIDQAAEKTDRSGQVLLLKNKKLLPPKNRVVVESR